MAIHLPRAILNLPIHSNIQDLAALHPLKATILLRPRASTTVHHHPLPKAAMAHHHQDPTPQVLASTLPRHSLHTAVRDIPNMDQHQSQAQVPMADHPRQPAQAISRLPQCHTGPPRCPLPATAQARWPLATSANKPTSCAKQ